MRRIPPPTAYSVRVPAVHRIGHGRLLAVHPAGHTADAGDLHQPFHLVTTNKHAVTDGCFPELAPAIDLAVFLPQSVDAVGGVRFVEFCARGTKAAGLMGVKGARGNRDPVGGECVADWLDPEAVAVGADEVHNHRSLRSSSAWAKKADAVFKISLARRSLATSLACSS